MANAVNYLSQIQDGQTIQAVHVNQFVNALSGSAAYDLVTSGSYRIIGPLYATASWATNALNANSSSYALSSSFTTTASYAISASSAAASSITNYTVGGYNGTLIYPQGTIYTKFENVFASQSAVTEYDLLGATTTFTGTRILPAAYTQADTTGEAKILKFNIKGSIGGNHTGGANGTIDSYVKIGTSVITGTNLGSINLSAIDNVPFEIDYELIFANNFIYGCGAIGWCKNSDFKRQALANLYLPAPSAGAIGALQFIISGSSDIIITGSAAYVEFIN